MATTNITPILDPINVPKSVKADACDAFHESASPEDFKVRFDKLQLPNEVKAQLWDAKFSSKAAQAPDLGNQALSQFGLSASAPQVNLPEVEQEPGFLQKLWSFANTGLITPEAAYRGAERAGSRSGINLFGAQPTQPNPTYQEMAAAATAPPTLAESESPVSSAIFRGLLGASGDAGSMGLQMGTSPLGVATAGAGTVARVPGVIGKAARIGGTGAAVGFGVEGARTGTNAITGSGEFEGADTPTRIQGGLQGASQVLFGAAGARSGAPEAYDVAVRKPVKAISKVAGPVRETAANRLRESARKQYERVINPTTNRNKNITAKVVPELLDRGVIATSPEGLAKKAQSRAESAGQRVEDIWEGLPEGTSVEAKPILERLDAYKKEFQNTVEIAPNEAAKLSAEGGKVDIVDGPNGTKKYVKIIDVDADAVSAVNQLESMIQQHGDKIPATSIRKVRKIFDEKVAKAGGYAGIPLADGSKIDAARELASAARSEIAKIDPNMRDANAEFAFWENVRKVADATAKRRVGQQGGLKKIIYGAAGATIGSSAGPHGTVAGLEAGKLASRVGSSALFNTTSAVVKNKLANAISPRRALPFLPEGGNAPAIAAPVETPKLPPAPESPLQAILPKNEKPAFGTKEAAVYDLENTYKMSEADVQKIVETAGAKYNGIWDASASNNGLQVQVTDPKTGMTITVPVKEITPEYVRGALDARRQQFQGEQAATARPEAEKQKPSPIDSAETPEVVGAVAPPVNGVGKMDPAYITPSPARFQYKAGTDAEGVGTLLKEQSRYNPDLGGVISVWVDPADAGTYVINGHHRLELAKRTGAKEVVVRHINAKNASEARAVGALQNIAEGRGTPVDAAKFFRDTGITVDDLKAQGISLGEATAAKGLALSKLDDALFGRVATGEMPVERAVAIGESTPDHAEQRAIVELIEKQERRGKRITNETLRELVKFVKGSEQTENTVLSLFGEEHIAQSLAIEKADVSAYVKQQLSRDKRLFGYVSKESRASELERGNNIIDVETSKNLAEQATQGGEIYDKLSSRSGPIADVLDAAARRIANGESANAVKQQAYDAIREELSRTVPGGQGAGNPQSGRAKREFSVGGKEEKQSYRQGAKRGELDWGGSGVSNDQLASWIKSKSSKLEQAGVQNTLFGTPEKVYRLTRIDSAGAPERALVTESQLRTLAVADGKNLSEAMRRGRSAPQGALAFMLSSDTGKNATAQPRTRSPLPFLSSTISTK